MAEDTKTQVVSKLIDSIPALLIVLGTLFVGLAISRGITYGMWFPISDLPSRIISGVFGITLIAFGLFGVKPRGGIPTAKDYAITIDHPKPGAPVDVTDVRGSIKKPLPDGYTLKVFRVYAGESFYPLRDCRIDNDHDRWEAAGCDLGSATQGETRVFAVNIVGPDGSALIDYLRAATQVYKTVRDALQAATGTKNIPYLPLIQRRTRDMIECARVEVRRV